MLAHNLHADLPVIPFELDIDKEITPCYKGHHDVWVLFHPLVTMYR